MQPRLSDLTHEMAHRSKIVAANQFLWLAARHRGDRWKMAEDAKRNRFASRELEQVLMTAIPAADPTTPGWAAELAPYAGLTVEWVKSLTSRTLLGQMAVMRAPFLTKTIADVTPGAAAWVAPGAPIPMARMTFAATGQMDMKKVAVIIPFTDESLESWTPTVQANIEDLSGRVVRLTIDRSLLDPDLGVTTARPASLTNGIVASQSTGSSAAQIVADLAAAIGPVIATSADPSRIVIVLSPATALFLSKLKNAAGSSEFQNLGVNGGDIWGIRVLVTPAAVFVGSPSANLIAVIDASRVIVADDGLMMVDASNVASLQFSDAPAAGPTTVISAFQTGTTALRIAMWKNFVRANDTAVRWFPVAY